MRVAPYVRAVLLGGLLAAAPVAEAGMIFMGQSPGPKEKIVSINIRPLNQKAGVRVIVNYLKKVYARAPSSPYWAGIQRVVLKVVYSNGAVGKTVGLMRLGYRVAGKAIRVSGGRYQLPLQDGELTLYDLRKTILLDLSMESATLDFSVKSRKGINLFNEGVSVLGGSFAPQLASVDSTNLSLSMTLVGSHLPRVAPWGNMAPLHSGMSGAVFTSSVPTSNVIPEPQSWILLLVGGVGLGALLRFGVYNRQT